MNLISRTLIDKYQHKVYLFHINDPLVAHWVEDLWTRIIADNRLDLTLYDPKSRMIDADTLTHRNVREIGTEWICYNACHPLGINEVLTAKGFSEMDVTLVWDVYNTIREIENTLRALKTGLDLRPIYHKKDDSTVAHLCLGLLAYWLVNTIRCQLKAKGINTSWKEIVRIGSTQKVITTVGYNKAEQEISVKKCSLPEQKL